MNRRITAAAAALALPAGILGVLALPATAAPDSAPKAQPVAPLDAASPEMLSAMQRDLGLSADEARTRLGREDRATRTEARLRKQLGTAYAGAWLSGDTATLNVAVTTAAAAEQVRASGARAKLVSRNAEKLSAVKAGLDRTAGRASASAIPAWYVDEAANTVVVLARDTVAARSFVAAARVDGAAVRIETSAEAPRLLYDVRGGDAYYMGGRCSVGLSVQGGFVTAGHCGSTGTAVQGFNRVAMGSFAGSSFPGNDYAWVRVNSNWTPQPWVNNYSGGNVIVAGGQEAATGASICRSGSTTGWHCGTIQAKNSTVNYPQGTVTGLTRTNVCAEPGDSGGGWISGQQGQGVTSGGSGNCTSGGTTYYQPLVEILNVYNLTLVTSGGGGGTPPPPPPPPPPGGSGCTGYEFTVSGSVAAGARANTQSYQSTVTGTHRGCVAGPAGTDFDLYLQKLVSGAWRTVASGTTPSNRDTLSYTGTAGTYRYQVHAYSGGGSVTVGYSNP
jgi:streptogrisin C